MPNNPAVTDPRLPERVAAKLGRVGAPASWLWLEITENSLMADPERAIALLTRLRELGVRIAIDDFGTGSRPSPTCIARRPIR